MTKIASAVTQKVLQKMTAVEGVWPASQVRSQNVAADLAERSAPTHYPAVHVYCEKIVNDLKEKFRSFSGRAHMAIELRYSQDRLEGLEEGTGSRVWTRPRARFERPAATGATACFTRALMRSGSAP